MKNKITSSIFRSKGIFSVIENPSPLIHTLMSGISVEKPETLFDSVSYYHKDIGTQEEMEQLFQKLENVKN